MTDTNTPKNKRGTKTFVAATAVALIGAIGLSAGAEAFGGKDRHGSRGMGFGGPAIMQGLDADANGTVTEAEVEARLLELFATADANDDGAVTLEEMREARQDLREQMRGERGEERRGRWQRGSADDDDRRGGRHQERHAKRGEDGERGGRGSRMFHRADADENGSVSEAEFRDAISVYTDNIAARANNFLERQESRFQTMDKNGDGVISQDEFREGRGGRR